MPRPPFLLLLCLGLVGCNNLADSSSPGGAGPKNAGLKVPAAPPKENLAITGATLIHPASGAKTESATVLIKDGRIEKITTGGAPPTYRNVHAKGKFLIPGLWDMHVHWFHSNSMGLFLANGVTGIRMMSGAKGHFDWRSDFESGEFATPRIYLGSRIVDGPRPVRPNSSYAISSPEQGREIVRQLKKEGWDFLKIYQLVEPDSYKAILDEAQKQDFPVHGHLPSQVSIRDALHAGQLCFEHLLDPVNTQFQRDGDKAGLLKLWKEKGAFLSPTMAVVKVRGYWRTDEYQNNPDLKYIPQSIIGGWPTLNSEDRNESSDHEISLAKQILMDFHRAGIPIVAGSDCYMNRLVPGFSLHDELALMVEAGMSPKEALQASTTNAAKLMKREDIGLIKPGALADLTLLDANPLEDIRNTRRVYATISDGRLYDRATLDALLKHAERAAPAE